MKHFVIILLLLIQLNTILCDQYNLSPSKNPSERFISIEKNQSIDKNPKCDLTTPSSICIYSTIRITPPTFIEKTLSLWSFDSVHYIDSVNNNNAVSNSFSVPGHYGLGTSLVISPHYHIKITDSPYYHSSESNTLSFYLFIANTSPTKSYNILSREDTSISLLNNVLTFRLPHYNDRIVTLESPRLISSHWYLITILQYPKRYELYINGIHVGTMNIHDIGAYSTLFSSESDIVLGGEEPDDDSSRIFIDELAIIGRALEVYEIEALSNIDSFSYVGADSILFEDANESCAKGYHLCSLLDYSAGAYQVAKLFNHNKVWSSDDKKVNNQEKRAAFCCRD